MGLPTAKIQQMIDAAVAAAVGASVNATRTWWEPIAVDEGERNLSPSNNTQFTPLDVPAGVDVAYPFRVEVRAALVDSDKVSHTKVATREGIVVRDGAGDLAVIEQDLTLNAGSGDLSLDPAFLDNDVGKLGLSFVNLNGSFDARFFYRVVLGPAISTTA